jgi:hypothetical protein
MMKIFFSILGTLGFLASITNLNAQNELFFTSIEVLNRLENLTPAGIDQMLSRRAKAFGVDLQYYKQQNQQSQQSSFPSLSRFPDFPSSFNQPSRSSSYNLILNSPNTSQKLKNLEEKAQRGSFTSTEALEYMEGLAPFLTQIWEVQRATIDKVIGNPHDLNAISALFTESTLLPEVKKSILSSKNADIRSALAALPRELTRLQQEIETKKNLLGTKQNEIETLKQAALDALPTEQKNQLDYLKWLSEGGAAAERETIIEQNEELNYRRWILDPNVAASEAERSRQNGDHARADFILWFSPHGIQALDNAAKTILTTDKLARYEYLQFVMNGGESPRILALTTQAMEMRVPGANYTFAYALTLAAIEIERLQLGIENASTRITQIPGELFALNNLKDIASPSTTSLRR